MKILLYTATRGAGKTTHLTTLVTSLISEGISVHGMTSPAVFEDGLKVGINLVLLPHEKPQVLAVPKLNHHGYVPGAVDGNVGYTFNETTLRAANEYFAALRARADHLQGIVVIDEIGPFEVVRGRGITEALNFIDDGVFEGVVIVTVRPEMVDMLLERWPEAIVVDLHDTDGLEIHLRNLHI